MGVEVVKTVNVLLVDDQDFWHKTLMGDLQGTEFEITSAYDIFEARRILKNRDDIDVILIDDCLRGREIDTLDFVAEVKKMGFAGKVVAFCSNCNNGDMLLWAGCDQSTIKSHAHELLRML